MADDILGDLEFEQLITGMDDRGLLEFVARQQHAMSKICPDHDTRLKRVEGRRKKSLGASGGIGAVVGAAIVGVIDYFARRGG